MGKVVAVCLSLRKGEKKRPAAGGRLIADHGLEGDAHSGPGHRQVSLLARESVDRFRAKGPLDVGPGDFAENILIEGLDLAALAVGRRLRAGPEAVLEITQLGKECRSPCAIYRMMGDCVMPREGVFARVIRGGEVRPGDGIDWEALPQAGG
jgi:MOSC domain-containing protein YiiM